MKRKSLIALAATTLLPLAIMASAAPSSTHTAATMTVAGKTRTTTMSKSIKPVHINTASVAQLETLPGIGPKLAAEIVKHRPYKNAASLEAKVKGIGPKLWANIKAYVRFN